jgi:anti-sigma B factor antagonist
MTQMRLASTTPLIVPCLETRLDAESGLRLQTTLLDLADRGHTRIVVDLGSVTSITASAIAALLAVFKALGPEGRLLLSGMSDKLANMFALTKMDGIFTRLHDEPSTANPHLAI